MRHSWLVLALVLAACDEEKVDVVGLERKVEVLEQQQREAEEVRGKLETQLKGESDANAKLTADLDATKAELVELRARIDEVEASAVKKVAPSVIAGRPLSGTRYKVELGDAQTRGSADARVTIVMFSDFQCPFCKRVMPTIAELEKEYGKDLRFAMKHNPLAFHNRAKAAALAAEAAGKQGKFWEMHDLLYENGRDLTDENFSAWAKDLKLDVGRFERDLDSADLGDRIDEHQAQAVRLGARGTPSFFINGRFLSGAQPAEAFKKVIDEELREADKLIAAGTPASGVYEKVIASGLEKPE